jgi:UDP-N-acetylglucosamine acyltransferase
MYHNSPFNKRIEIYKNKKSCILQAEVHVAHHGEIGDQTTLVAVSMLGGTVELGQKCFIGGGAAIHQNVFIGDYAILSENETMALDLPPSPIAVGASTVIGLNLVHLRHDTMDREKSLP